MTLQHCRHCSLLLAGRGEERVWRCPRCDSRLSQVWLPDAPRAASGSYPDDGRTYASVDDFLFEDPQRLGSREIDFGLYWSDAKGGDIYRAAWVEATDELYLVQSGRPELGGGHVEVLAVSGRARLEAALSGWSERCRESGSLAWLRERAGAVSGGLAL